MALINGGEILTRALKTEGVSTVFNLPGDPMGPINTAMKQGGMKIYSFRHEQATAMAAQAYGYANRTIGVGVVASGPAMTNAITGLETARSNCWPMLLIGGNGEQGRRHRGDFQEAPQVEAAEPFCKWSVAIDNPRQIPYYVHEAVRRMMNGRPLPVYLDMPSDVIAGRAEESEIQWFPKNPEPVRPLADPRDVKQAVELFSKAKRPLLLIGKGVAWSDAASETRQLVDRLQAPFVPSPMGKGVVPDDHPLNAQGARTYALQNADVVLLAGGRFNWIFHFGAAPRFSPDVKFIHLDIEPSEIGNGRAVEVGLAGDAKAVFGQMLQEIGNKRASIESEWLQALEAEKKKNAETIASMVNSNDSPMNMYRMFRDVMSMLDRDATVCADGENTMAISRVMANNYFPRHRLDAGVSGCMGVSIPYSLGAQAARPGKQVVSFNGDYAFGWNGIEVETAVRHRLPVLFVVANNVSIGGPSGMELGQRVELTEQPEGIHYDRMMEALGGHGEYVETVEQLKPAVERSLKSGKPSLVNVVIDKRMRRKQQQHDWMTGRSTRMNY
jgi:2-hydroxyacyl-CoA lyase 1